VVIVGGQIKVDMDVESLLRGYVALILVPAGEAAPRWCAGALVAETEAEMKLRSNKPALAAPNRTEDYPHQGRWRISLSYSRKAWLCWYRGG